MELYYIDYKFLDELDDSGWRTSNIIIYDSSTPEGKVLQDALDKDDDGELLEEVLWDKFHAQDDDIVIYFDRNGIEDESLVLEIQHSHDILINKITKVEQTDKEKEMINEILKWVGKNYGSQEMDNPSWNVRDLAHTLIQAGL